jgi:hypothetical protein
VVNADKSDLDGAEEGTEYRLKAPLVVSQPANGNPAGANGVSGSIQGAGAAPNSIPVPTPVVASP